MDSYELHALDLSTFTWKKVEARGAKPEARDEHSAVLHKDSMIIFGGFQDSGRSNDIHRYNFIENTWEQLKPVNAGPVPRAAHSAVMHGDNLVVFGGKDDEG